MTFLKVRKFRLLANNIPGTVYLSENDSDHTKLYLNDEIEKVDRICKIRIPEKKNLYGPDPSQKMLS
jgi:hypothetical protein